MCIPGLILAEQGYNGDMGGADEPSIGLFMHMQHHFFPGQFLCLSPYNTMTWCRYIVMQVMQFMHKLESPASEPASGRQSV
jgi:hypothetical protein